MEEPRPQNGRSREPAAGDAAGWIFDIKEFAVHDGPGIRLTLFLKGCPLRCQWCHNPEGIDPRPQPLTGPNGARVVGRRFTPDEAASIINAQAAVLRANEGGVTFSGGEPLRQAAFVAAVIDRLDNVHVLLDTSGFAPESDFRMVVGRCDLVYFDLKLMDDALHRAWTGVGNAGILANLRRLADMGVPFVVRVPLVPGVTDTPDNLRRIAAAVKGLPGLERVDLLPYNRAAGGKYRAAGMEFAPDYDEARPCNTDTGPFIEHGIEARVT